MLGLKRDFGAGSPLEFEFEFEWEGEVLILDGGLE